MVAFSNIAWFKANVLIRRLPLLFLAQALVTATYSQAISRYVISAYGDNYDNNFQSVQATVGEPAIFTFSDNSTFFLTEGFQQPSPSERPPEEYLVKLEVYPNPASDIIKVRFFVRDIDDFTIRIFDIVGNLMYESEIKNVFSGQVNPINIARFSQGLYLINVYSSNGKMKLVEKIVKN